MSCIFFLNIDIILKNFQPVWFAIWISYIQYTYWEDFLAKPMLFHLFYLLFEHMYLLLLLSSHYLSLVDTNIIRIPTAVLQSLIPVQKFPSLYRRGLKLHTEQHRIITAATTARVSSSNKKKINKNVVPLV